MDNEQLKMWIRDLDCYYKTIGDCADDLNHLLKIYGKKTNADKTGYMHIVGATFHLGKALLEIRKAVTISKKHP